MTIQATTIATPEIARCEATLKSRLSELLRLRFDREELRIENLADPLDQIRLRIDREIAVRQYDHEASLVRDIQSALAKIEAGIEADNQYGTCEECGEPIPYRRLAALPWAPLCVPCQSHAEVSAHGRASTLRKAA